VTSDRLEVRDLPRVQYLEGTGRATTAWFVATPDTVGDLSLILKVRVHTPVSCSFAVKLPVGTPLTWRGDRSPLRRATALGRRLGPAPRYCRRAAQRAGAGWGAHLAARAEGLRPGVRRGRAAAAGELSAPGRRA